MSRKLNHTNQQIEAWVAAYYKTNGYWPTQLETRAALRCSIERAATSIKEVKNNFANGLEQALVKALAAHAGFASLEGALTHIGALTEKPVSNLTRSDLRALVTLQTGSVPSDRLNSEALRNMARRHRTNTGQE